MPNSSQPQRDAVILKKLERVRAEVGPARQKVIDYVLECPDDVIHLSVTELADLAGTSEATVVRLFQELDFKGYQDFKIQLSQSLTSSHQDFDREIAAGDSPESVLATVFAVSERTLRETRQVVDRAAFGRAVALLAAAGRIEFIGAGGSGVVALDACHKFIRLGIPVNAASDGHNAAQVCAVLDERSVVVAFSHSGSTKDILEAAGLARDAGAQVIAVTRYGRSPLSKLADVVLHTLSPETNYRSEAIASRIAQLALIDSLMVSVYLARQPDAARRLEQAREALRTKRL